MSDLRFPIGKFQPEAIMTEAKREQMMAAISAAPAQVRAAVADLSDEQLDTPYREGGWTVRQVVHHLPDSHLNSYVRFRLALTEEQPTIKPYDEAQWAELTDAKTAPIELSLNLLESLHKRWEVLLRSLTAQDFARAFQHPELGLITLDTNLCIYAWHGRHHIAQITALAERQGWR